MGTKSRDNKYLVAGVLVDSLDCYDFVGVAVLGLAHNPKGSIPDDFQVAKVEFEGGARLAVTGRH